MKYSTRFDIEIFIRLSDICILILKDFNESMRATDKRMTSERCAFLSLVAIAHKLEEAWLCFFPVLPLMYISQYLPTIGKRFVV